MLRGALVPSLVAAALCIVALGLWRGGQAAGSAALGCAVTIAFFASGLVMMSRLVRSANAMAFMAVGMAVYFGQILALLIFLILFRDAAWIDGPALAYPALIVTIVWQGFAMRAMRRARIPVYDEPSDRAQR